MKAQITASKLNVRKAPNGDILGQVSKGDDVTCHATEGGWTEIEFHGGRGWVSTQFLAIQEGEDCLVTASRLNLRKSPDGEILGALMAGDKVVRLAEENGWSQVKTDELEGYVASRYLSEMSQGDDEDEGEEQGFHYQGDRAIAPDGSYIGKKFRLGVYNAGATDLAKFVTAHRDEITEARPEEIAVMEAVSPNEGKFEAINTWDNSFLSFGIYQWTLGAANSAGELPALLARLKEVSAETYQKHFGDHGLEFHLSASGERTIGRGFLVYEGKTVNTALEKERFRTLQWAHRFYEAGKDPKVQLAQFYHGLERIGTFYHEGNKLKGELGLTDYFTSQYAVGLLLDQHINRPGHLLKTTKTAIEAVAGELDVANPSAWGDAEEMRLIEVYLSERAKTSMTDSQGRADRVKKAVERGVISSSRNSFLS